MKIIYSLLVLVFLVSCSTTSKKAGELSQEDQRIKAVIFSVDSKIYGSYGKENKGDFSKFSEVSHTSYLNESKSPRFAEMRDILPLFDKKEFIPSTETYLLCGYSSKLNIAFCDDAACQGTEYFEKTNNPKIIETWKQQLPLKQCISTAESETTAPEAESTKITMMKVSPKKEIILDHKYFVVSYNEDHKLPNWVSYQLLASNLKKGIAHRRDKFFADPTLISMKVPYAKPTDFNGKIYDRGHLAPSEDFIWDQDANDETFVMSNMTPQKKKLNRGAWKSLETKVRNWACTEEEIKVISGPVLEKDLKKFKSKVSIPQKFFKIVIDETPPKKAIAFVFEQDDKKFDTSSKATSLAEAEKLAGYQFEKESGLSNSEYTKLRTTYKVDDWVEGDCIRKIGKN